MYNDCVRSNEAIAQNICRMVAGTVEGFFMVLNESKGTTVHNYVAVIDIANSHCQWHLPSPSQGAIIKLVKYITGIRNQPFLIKNLNLHKLTQPISRSTMLKINRQ
jgi:hypothetical protein